jgi:hypothetical protein
MRQFPQELIDNTIHHLVEDSETSDVNMRTCSLVAKSWTPQAQKEQFQSVYSLTLDTSKKLLALIVGSPHIGAYIKFLTLRVDSFDVGTETRDLAVLPELPRACLALKGWIYLLSHTMDGYATTWNCYEHIFLRRTGFRDHIHTCARRH